ncbi:hypothetical protein ACQPZX_48070 [Actinoplanes sp. CA-142083]|uniref:hypothetical protein n=1 Tax=Actinoplanes sp. CA-142083 TaxID=3239903 RepID=UPI003D924388
MWLQLPQEIQKRIDDELRNRRLIQAIKLVREEGGLEPKPGLYEAQNVVMDRLAWLSEQGLIEPEPTVELPQLIAAAKAIPDRVAAIEAVWDGDTFGWMVWLGAIVERPGQHHERFDEVGLAGIRRGGDIRLFLGEVPPWPEAAEATEKGHAVAAALGVPFHFTQPDTPDLDLMRWWDTLE